MPLGSSAQLQPDISELLLGHDQRSLCETYIFEPAAGEVHLGRLLAVAEVENGEDGIERELLDMAITAVQREYYRDSSRGVLSSFEAALRQANLVLHDSANQGVRDWMRYFHVAIGVLVGTSLHLSVAGKASISIRRHNYFTGISQELSHSPVTDPLQTFSQVASGTLAAGDVLFFGTLHFLELFDQATLLRFSLDQSAATIQARLRQWYGQRQSPSMAMLTVVMTMTTPTAKTPASPPSVRQPLSATVSSPRPRKPLVIYRSRLQSVWLLIRQLGIMIFQTSKQYIWPLLKRFFHQLRQLVVRSSRSLGYVASRSWSRRPAAAADQTISPPAAPSMVPSASTWRSYFKKAPGALATAPHLPKAIWQRLKAGFSSMPMVSKFLLGLTVLLTIALSLSLVLLYHKRTEDTTIQRASELLHEARTKQQAAASALIYNNRDQANTLLNEAETLTKQLSDMGVYVSETTVLTQAIQEQRDRAQRIWRIPQDQARVLGDFAQAFPDQPQRLFLVDGSLYTYNPKNNAIARMDSQGGVSVVSQVNQGIGFLEGGVAHQADKSIILITAEPGIALFDSKSNTLSKQDITWPSANPVIRSLALYGNRLYMYDETSDTIYGYSKTLRGYSGGEAWIKDDTFPRQTIMSLTIDGAIYTLHTDGSIRKLFKGVPSEFTSEAIAPPLQQPAAIITSPDFAHLYVFDPPTKRVVVFNKKGQLQQQIYINSAVAVTDIAIADDELTLFALQGSQVIRLALQPASTPAAR